MEYFFHENDITIVVEVEPDKCIAYYYAGEKITGDVWLFNIGETPEKPPWKQGGPPPYQNSSEYCYPHKIILPIIESDFDTLFPDDDNPDRSVKIYFRGLLIGLLADNWRPGYSTFARLDSGVAKTMGHEIPRPT